MNQSKAQLQSQSIVFFIFGGTGDLTSRKLIPALYNLFIDGWMPKNFKIIGLGRTNQSSDQFKGALKEDVTKFSRRSIGKEEQWNDFAKRVDYLVSEIQETKTYEDISNIVNTCSSE